MDAAKARSEVAEKQVEAELTALENLLKVNPVDKDAVELQLVDVDSEVKLFLPVQEKYVDLLIAANKEAEHTAEEAKSLGFRKRINRARAAVVKLGVAAGTTATTTVPAYQINLPKRSLPKFDGDVRQYKAFWAAFEEIDKNTLIPEIEKYNYLREHMVPGSRAEKAVLNFQPDRNSYQLAKTELQERFGREATLIKVCVRDLLELMDLSKKKKRDFVDVATALQSQIMYLGQLGVTKDKYGLLLYPIIESSIPREVLDKYLEMPGCKEELDDILDFLKKEVRRREESALAQAAFCGKEEEKKNSSKKNPVPTATDFINVEAKTSCGFCGNNHPTIECRKSTKMSMDDRKAALRKANVCFKCLGRNHLAKKCRSKVTCVSCGRQHHVLMCNGGAEAYPPQGPYGGYQQYQGQQQQGHYHDQQQFSHEFGHPPVSPQYPPGGQPNYSQQFVSPQQQRVPQQTGKSPPSARHDHMNFIQKPEVLLETMMVRLFSPSGETVIARCMVDTGAQSSYIKRSRVDEMQLAAVGKERVIHQTFGAKLSGEVEHPVVRVAIAGVQHPYQQLYTFTASVLEEIAKDVIAIPDGPWIRECAEFGIPLTDVKKPSDIDIMIGNDVAPYLSVGMRSMQLPSSICAFETRVGWYLAGKLPKQTSQDPTKAMMCINMHIADKDVESYWALETIGIRDGNENKTRVELEHAALDHFHSTVKQDSTGRYEVHLPYIEGHPTIPDNRGLAFRRLEKTSQDLIRDGHLEAYDKIFQPWYEEGIIEKVDDKQSSAAVHYLGHRAVFKENSTTPVRPVFNASAKTKITVSLNDFLEKGPNLLDLIPSILSRFRMNAIGVVSDIRKAFLQLKVAVPHRDSLRFLWWEDTSTRKKVVEYRHCRVVFGVSSSPFLLGAVIQHLLEKKQDDFPDTVSTLKASFYVDNCCASLSTVEEVQQFRREAEQIFSSAQMDLRGWEYGPTSQGKIVPVLGLLWDTGADNLQLDLKKMLSEREKLCTTPRSVLKLANSLYDPLGLFSPFVITIKILFKHVCADERKLSWDTELPTEYAKEMKDWVLQLTEIAEVKIPRVVPDIHSSKRKWSVHVFCDASKEAYACCVYLRSEDPVRVQLVQARARVTPKKAMTIPRAELLSCLVAARLYCQVVADLDMVGVPVTFWSDSTTALSWIRRTDTVWGVFVNRRVEEIRRLTRIEDWRHVPGTINIADMPSRGVNATKFIRVFRSGTSLAELFSGPGAHYRYTKLFMLVKYLTIFSPTTKK